MRKACDSRQIRLFSPLHDVAIRCILRLQPEQKRLLAPLYISDCLSNENHENLYQRGMD